MCRYFFFLVISGLESRIFHSQIWLPSNISKGYDNPIPARFLVPIDCSKIPAQNLIIVFIKNAVIAKGPLQWRQFEVYSQK